MKIDIHNHPDWYGYNTERFIANMDERGIDKTVLLAWDCPMDEVEPSTIKVMVAQEGTMTAPIPFKNAVPYVEKAPDRFYLGYAPDPRKADACDRLRAFKMLYDIKICGEVKLRMMYDNPDALRLWKTAGELGLPVLVHLDYCLPQPTNYPRPDYWYGGGIFAFERAIAACPGTNFIGHAPGFWCHISNDDLGLTTSYPKGPVIPGGEIERMLDTYPNFYCDMSAGSGCNALSRDKEFTRKFLIKYADRVCYGRDFFDNIHQELIASLNLPQDVLDKIYYQNAVKLLGLSL